MKLNWSNLPSPIIALSPMADMTDSAFCRVVKAKSYGVMELWSHGVNVGADFLIEKNKKLPLPTLHDSITPRLHNSLIVFREMVSSEAVVRGNQKTLEMTKIHLDERPLIQQIFGSDPEVMAEATRIIDSEHNPEGFDVNMGCPVYKLVCNFNGASLMKEPECAAAIVKAIKTATTKPISVKIRLGWSDPTECFEFAKILEDAGADLLTVHGRTKMQGYSGDSDWEMIAKLKQTLSIPILANGDIFTAPLAINALKQTGCDGILIARGALGNPWIFRQIAELLSGQTPTPISIHERVETIKFHLHLHCEQYGEKAVATFRKHLTWYLKGLGDIKKYKERLHTVITHEEMESILDELWLDEIFAHTIAHRDAVHPLAATRMRMTK